MKKNAYDPHYYYLDEVYINEIIFDETGYASIFGYLKDAVSEELKRWDFVCPFGILTDILLTSDEQGDVLIKIISEKLSADTLEIPSIVSAETLFGAPLKVDTLVIRVYKSHGKDISGNWKPIEDNLIIIDAIEEKSLFVRNNPHKYISRYINNDITKDIMDEAVNFLAVSEDQKMLNECLLMLDNAYRNYCLLLDKAFTQKLARKQAGLSNELLYRIAFYNHKVINNHRRL